MSRIDFVLRIPHPLGIAQAKRRLATGVAAAQTQYNTYFRTSEIKWDGNRLIFCLTALAQTVRGTVDIEKDFVELRTILPTEIQVLTEQFVPVIQDTVEKLLAQKE